MKKVITYGTFDLLHHGHVRLLERAKELGDYLVVGITSNDFDKKRGKINVQQSLMERVKAVKDTGIADEIIIEEYEGQKIEDICKFGIDIFTVGSDWEGQFDYLKEYCEVVYLPRTMGISSSEIRSSNKKINIGLVGECRYLEKVLKECNLVNGVEVTTVLCEQNDSELMNNLKTAKNYEELLNEVDAVYLASNPSKHYDDIKKALLNKKHVLCESPVVLTKKEFLELDELANKNNCILMESIKTAYSTAYTRLLLLLKMGEIGKIVSVDSTCTSLKNMDYEFLNNRWNSICSWGTTAMLPIFQILGTKYKDKKIISLCHNNNKDFDLFTKIDFMYNDAVASLKVGKGVKSEGELVITGTNGYVYVPAPWWKMDYFEIRYENPNDNKRYFYQLDGEGIRNEILSFSRSILGNKNITNIDKNVTIEICKVIEDFYNIKEIIEY